jgi:outer membrane protein assembly factor BamB
MIGRAASFSAAAALASVIAARVALGQPIRTERPATLVAGTPLGGARSERVDGARTGWVRSRLPTVGLYTAWRAALGMALERAPVVDSEGTLYVASLRGEIVALSADGTERWRLPTGAASPGPLVLLTDGTLVFVDAAGSAIGVRDGAIRWRTKFGRADTAHPAPIALDDGGVVVATSHELAALDSVGGERARTTLPEPSTLPLVSALGRVVVVTTSGSVWAWTPGAPEPTQLGSFGSAVPGGAALADAHTLVAVTAQGHLSALDLARGTTSVRATSTGGALIGPPTMGHSIAYLTLVAPTGEFAVGVDRSGAEVTRVLLASHTPLAAADGGTPPPPMARTATLVDAAGTIAFATPSGSVGVVTHAGDQATAEMVADVCPPGLAGGARSTASVVALAPLVDGVFAAACGSGSVVAIQARGAAVR